VRPSRPTEPSDNPHGSVGHLCQACRDSSSRAYPGPYLGIRPQRARPARRL